MVEDIRKELETGDRAAGNFTNVPAFAVRDGLAGRRVVLSVLARAADQPEFMTPLADDLQATLKEYYTLTREEKAALAGGDIQKIESWVGRLDKGLLTWLLYRLSRRQ